MTDDFIPQQPGAFKIELSKTDPGTKAWLFYRCPCGCGSGGQLALIQPMSAEHDRQTWNWDGNHVKPTLSPSIRRNIECKFHGHLQKGMWTACSDSPPIHKECWRPGIPQADIPLRGNRPENVIMDDPLNQEKTALEELVVDMAKEPAGNAKHRRAVIFCNHYTEAFEYMRVENMGPENCLVIASTTYQLPLNHLKHDEWYAVTVGGWDQVGGVRDSHDNLQEKWRQERLQEDSRQRNGAPEPRLPQMIAQRREQLRQEAESKEPRSPAIATRD